MAGGLKWMSRGDAMTTLYLWRDAVDRETVVLGRRIYNRDKPLGYIGVAHFHIDELMDSFDLGQLEIDKILDWWKAELEPAPLSFNVNLAPQFFDNQEAEDVIERARRLV